MTIDLFQSESFKIRAERVAADEASTARLLTFNELVKGNMNECEALSLALIRTEDNFVAPSVLGTPSDPLILQFRRQNAPQELEFEVFTSTIKAKEFILAETPAQQSTLLLSVIENGLGALTVNVVKDFMNSAKSQSNSKSSNKKSKSKSKSTKEINIENYTVKFKLRIEPEFVSGTDCKVLVSVPAFEVDNEDGEDPIKIEAQVVTVYLPILELSELLLDPRSHFNLLYHRIVECHDWRKFSPEVRNEKRFELARYIVENSRLPEEQRLTQAEVAEKFHVSVNTVSSLKQELLQLTELSRQNLAESKKGRKNANFNKIPESCYNKLEQALQVVPSTYGLDYTTWTGPCVFDFVVYIMEVDVKMRYIYYFLHKMGYSLKVATKLHYKCDEKEIEAFKKNLRKNIEGYVKAGYTIVFEDETHLQQGNPPRGYGKHGQTVPCDHSTSTLRTEYTYVIYMGLKFISISLYKTTITSELFIITLENLKNANPGKKFLVILDNSPVHRSKEVEHWMNGSIGKKYFAFLFLPKYAPKLNPVEYLNNEFKDVMKKKVAHRQRELVANAREFMSMFVDKNNKTLPSAFHKITSYFRAKECVYFIRTYASILLHYCKKKKGVKEAVG